MVRKVANPARTSTGTDEPASLTPNLWSSADRLAADLLVAVAAKAGLLAFMVLPMRTGACILTYLALTQ
jgi:hypothetical protein